MQADRWEKTSLSRPGSPGFVSQTTLHSLTMSSNISTHRTKSWTLSAFIIPFYVSMFVSILNTESGVSNVLCDN